MAVFNVEVEFDWMESSGELFDDVIKREVVQKVKELLAEESKKEVIAAVNEEITKKIEEVDNTIQQAIDDFIANVCAEKIGNIMMPCREGEWSTKFEFVPLSEYVGKKFEEFLKEKRYDEKGKIPDYSRDMKYSAAQVMTRDFLDKELGAKVEKLIAKAQREVEQSLIESLEQKLKENLAKETIERMNIPDVIKRFSEMNLLEQK